MKGLIKIRLKKKMEQKNDKKDAAEKKAVEKKTQEKIAVVRVRGRIKVISGIAETLEKLRLYNNNFCVILKNDPKTIGMIKKAKDYVTWGNIDEETFKFLVEKRGEEYKGREKDSKAKISYSNKFFKLGDKKYKKFFRLNPPRKGFGRKGVKVPFNKGGALGDRAEKINDLIKRMI